MKQFSGIKSLSKRYADKYGLTYKEAELRIKEFLSVLREDLLDGSSDGVQFVDFLTLKKVKRKSKIGRDPRNPDKIYDIPPCIAIKCELGKKFKEELNS